MLEKNCRRGQSSTQENGPWRWVSGQEAFAGDGLTVAQERVGNRRPTSDTGGGAHSAAVDWQSREFDEVVVNKERTTEE